MSFLSTVRSRRSVRSFDGRALAESELQELLDFARTAENPYGIPLEWVILDTEKAGLSSPVIVGEKAYVTAKVPKVPHAEEAFGYSFERLVLFAAEKGIGTTWIAGTMDRKSFERAAEVKDGEIMPCVSPLGRAAKKMSLREIMMRKGISADSRFAFEKLFFRGSFETPLTADGAGDLADALEAVRWAPSACNYQPWRIVLADGAAYFYLKRNKGFGEGRLFDTQKIDIGIALCHFALAMEEAGRTVSLSLEDPGITAPDGEIFIASLKY